MKIEVLGVGCARCRSLMTAVRESADRLALDYSLEHVSDIKSFARHGVVFTPALVVDGKVEAVGRVPDEAELTSILTAAASTSCR